MRIVIALLLATICAASAHAELASATTLKQMAKFSDAIAIARVDKIVVLDGVKVAEATVVRALKGLKGVPRFAFRAQPTWSCDATHAVAGETILVFLIRGRAGIPYGGFLDQHPKYLSELKKRLGDTPFLGIVGDGAGRMPVVRHRGVEYISAVKTRDPRNPKRTVLNCGAILPSGTASLPDPKESSRRLVRLRDVERAITSALRAARR